MQRQRQLTAAPPPPHATRHDNNDASDATTNPVDNDGHHSHSTLTPNIDSDIDNDDPQHPQCRSWQRLHSLPQPHPWTSSPMHGDDENNNGRVILVLVFIAVVAL